MASPDYVKIAGESYMLSTDPDIDACLIVPQKMFLAADEGSFWQTWEMRSFQGGERTERILRHEDLDQHCYHDGEGVDVSRWGELKLQPSLDRSLAISSETLVMAVTNDGLTALVGHEKVTVTPDGGAATSYYLSSYDSDNKWQFIVTPNDAPVTDIVVGINEDIYAIQGSHIIKSTDNGQSWTNDETEGVPTDMVGLAYCANHLYALGPDYLKYWDWTEWTEAASWGGDYCCNYEEDVFWAKDNIIYRYNGVASFETNRLPQGFVIRGLYYYRSILFVPGYFNVQGGQRGAVFFLMDGRDGHLYSTGSYDGESQYAVCAVTGSDDEVYLATQKRGGADRFDLSVGGLASGPSWASPGNIPFKGMAYVDGKLLVGRYDDEDETDGVYLANVSIPASYRKSAWLTTSEYDFLFPSDLKVFSRVALRHKVLKDNESIKVEYSLDSGETYHLAGVSDSIGTEEKQFAITNARGQSIKLRLTLTGPGDSTPCVTYVRVDAAPISEPRWMWDLNLQVWENQQGRKLQKNLSNASNSQSVIDFQDQYGETHPVIFEFMRIKPLNGSKWSASIFVRLREV